MTRFQWTRLLFVAVLLGIVGSVALGDTDGDGWQSGTWAVTRGLYGGSHTDRVYGSVDEIRFSDEALDPTEFLFGKATRKANSPYPVDEAEDMEPEMTLSWSMGAYDSTLNLYFGESEDDLAELGIDLDVNSYDVGQLELGQTYYWRVDEVNDDQVFTGEVWSFSTPDSYVIDDMESYNNTSDCIFDTWVDGYSDEDNASQVGYTEPNYCELSIIHGGSQSMPFYYNKNDGDVSEATFDLGDADWTVGGLKTLSLYFLGDRENADGELYLEIDGSKATCDESLSQGIWKRWDVALSSLDVDLSDLDELVIGVDADDEGLVYIDDITVHMDDPEEIVAEDPGTDDLVLLYEMEKDLTDSAGSYDGDTDAVVSYDEGLEGLGYALEFDGEEDYVEMPIGSLISGLTDSTFSVWVYLADGDASWQRAFDIGTGTDNYLFLSPRLSTAGAVRAAIMSQDSDAETLITSDVAIPTEYWVNLALVFDVEAGTMSLYVGGELAGTVETTDFPANMGETTQNWLGDSQYEDDDLFDGLMDDFRIYNRSLSAGEILYLIGDR